MRRGHLLGLDVGTSSAKVVVFHPEQGVVGRASSGYPTRTVEAGSAEQHPEDWWRASTSALAAALRSAGIDGSSVGAIAVSGQGAAVVLLDRALDPLHPALIHLDQRAAPEARELAGSVAGQAIERANGQRVGSWNAAAKLAWFGRHAPRLRDEAYGITSAAGFVLARLTGRLVQSASDAGISDLFDLSTRTWSGAVLDALGLDPGRLPTVLPATAEAGPVVGELGTELGLTGAVVVAGGEDTSCAALAAGVTGRDDAYLSLGSAGVVGVAVERGSVREPRLLTFPHVRSDVDLMSGSMTSAGSALDWWATVTGSGAQALLEEVESSPSGGDASEAMFLPYLAGELHPLNDPDARGVFSGLSFASTRADLTRAILEGSASAIADNLEVAVAAGARPGVLSATGGPTRSPAWMRAVADATGRTIEVVDAQGAPVGDAFLAAAESDDESATLAAAHRQVVATYEPDERQMAAAAERRARAAGLYRALVSLRGDAP